MLVCSIFTFSLLTVFSQLSELICEMFCFSCAQLQILYPVHMSTPFLCAYQGPGARPADCSLPRTHSEEEEQTAAELQDQVPGIRWELGQAAVGSEEGPVSLEQGVTSEVMPLHASCFRGKWNERRGGRFAERGPLRLGPAFLRPWGQ